MGVHPPKNGLSLCAGGGGLDMGLMLAEPEFHTRCFVEWKEYPRQVLEAGQRTGYFAPAPIWDDVTTFDGRPWRGYADTILAGYPCQPFSQAGQRKGADDERHLWPHIARIIREIDPDWVFLENVAGHVTLGAETVLRDLRDLGFTPAVGLFTAEEAGASHERLRWFCVAHRDRDRCGAEKLPTVNPSGLAADRGGDPMVDTDGAQCAGPAGVGFSGERRGTCEPVCGCEKLGDAQSLGRGERRPEPKFWCRGNTAAEPGCELDDATCSGCTEWGLSLRKGAEYAQPADPNHPLFPPGPNDLASWSRVLAGPHSDLAPAVGVNEVLARALSCPTVVQEASNEALEPVVRRMADGLAARARALRLLGNGVVPLVAAHAWRTLSAAHGLGRVDLGAAQGREFNRSGGIVR